MIGNPPYDVLAERELTRDLTDDRAVQVRRFLSAFKNFIDAEVLYQPSKRGKNNLYKLFICRALSLLADDGRFGFIVPMALLGDDQAADLRAAMLDAGAFTSVDAFPQKDDPARRVFPEAKLSTTVFTMVKTTDEHAQQQPFTARQHPAAQIDESSPSLALQTDHIPLYDPANRSIVSCSQNDWDLAVKIMAGGRMTRAEQCHFERSTIIRAQLGVPPRELLLGLRSGSFLFQSSNRREFGNPYQTSMVRRS